MKKKAIAKVDVEVSARGVVSFDEDEVRSAILRQRPGLASNEVDRIVQGLRLDLKRQVAEAGILKS